MNISSFAVLEKKNLANDDSVASGLLGVAQYV